MPAQREETEGEPVAMQAARILRERRPSRCRELWLMARSFRDFIRGFRALYFAGPCVTVFGSARLSEAHPSYAVGREVGRRLSAAGFTVITGGGLGLMEAANRGAREAGGRSVGCNIRLPIDQSPNPYLDCWVTCQHFFVRKVLLFKYSYAFVALPGWLGTMDELFEALTLVRTRKIENIPIVLIGSTYWRPLMERLNQMVAEATIDAADLQLVMLTDDLDGAVPHIERHVLERFAPQVAPEPRRSRLLGPLVGMAPVPPKRAARDT